MSHLSDVAATARKAIVFGGVALVFLIVGRVILTAAVAYWTALHPAPPPPPDVKFGKLPKLVFPQTNQPQLTYTLQTATGGLPTNLPGQFTVYFMPIKKPSLLAFDNAKSIANKLNFIQDPTKLSETSYRWDLTDPIPASLTMDIITGAFILDRQWQADPSYLTPQIYYTDQQADDMTQTLLSAAGLLPDDIKNGTDTIQYLAASKGQLVPVVSLSQADFTQVNLYRQAINSTPVVNPESSRGLISAIIALQKDDAKQFIHLDYDYFPVDTTTSAVYPLITPSAAWQKLQNKQGFIVGVNTGVTAVTIRSVTLAYYDAEDPQQYMQPVYVFAGDDNFKAYVPAVADGWVAQ